MGIKDFYDLIDNDIRHVRSLSYYSGWRVAIDISIYLYMFVRSAGEVQWLDQLLYMVRCFIKYKIKPVYIFDGPNFPKEKEVEQKRRREVTKRTVEKKKELEKIRNQLLRKEYELNEEGIQKIRDLLHVKPTEDGTDYTSILAILDTLDNKIEAWEHQTTPVDKKYSDIAKQALSLMNVAWYQADGEAEKLCAHMCKEKRVDAVVSEDTDTLVYGCPVFLSKFNYRSCTVTDLRLTEVLHSLDMSFSTFVDLCIMMQCDYNSRVKGHGVKRCLGLIQQYKTIEECIPNMKGNADCLNKDICRRHFSLIKKDDNNCSVCGGKCFAAKIVPFSGMIARDPLKEFLEKQGSNVNLNHLLDAFAPTPVDWVEED